MPNAADIKVINNNATNPTTNLMKILISVILLYFRIPRFLQGGKHTCPRNGRVGARAKSIKKTAARWRLFSYSTTTILIASF